MHGIEGACVWVDTTLIDSQLIESLYRLCKQMAKDCVTYNQLMSFFLFLMHYVVLHAASSKTTFKGNRIYLVRVAPDCNRSYCEDSFSGYYGSV